MNFGCLRAIKIQLVLFARVRPGKRRRNSKRSIASSLPPMSLADADRLHTRAVKIKAGATPSQMARR